MMRHPFHGIVAAGGDAVALAEPPATAIDRCPSRRTFFHRVLAAMAGGAAILFSRSGDAAQPRSRYPGSRRGFVTTQAVGEEGGVPPRPPRPLPPGTVTTQAVGEEGGYTTYALGEEGGYTTYALGEEGAGRLRR